jgi:hypothetical protein
VNATGRSICGPLANEATALDQTRTFLDALYPDDVETPGWAVLFAIPGERATWLEQPTASHVAERALALADQHDVYIGMARQDRAVAVPAGKDAAFYRGGSATALAIPAVWIEVDWLDPVHTATNLPPTRGDALALVDEFELPPSVVVDSGHGLQAWWLFREPWVFGTLDERRDAQDLLLRFQATMRAKAVRHGWTVDSTHDLARVLRLPGTMNHKREPVVPVELVSFHRERRYSPDDFERYLIDSEALGKLARADGDMPAAVAPNTLTDEQIIDWARRAHGEKFALLWAGEWHKVRRAGAPAYKSQSDADYALLGILRFWTGGDAEKMDHLFRNSKLMRDKWDEHHFSGGKTYGEGSIHRSLSGDFETYTQPLLDLLGFHLSVRTDGQEAPVAASREQLPPLVRPRGRKLPPLTRPEGISLPPLARPETVLIEALA